MLDICKQLFTEWNKHSINYCHWKSNEHLDDGLEGKTDLDIFVVPEDKNQAEEDLLNCNYIKLRPQECNQYPNVDEWLGFDSNTGSLIHVHLHYQIITGTKYCKEYIYPIDKFVIDTRILDLNTGIYIISPELELIILYTRIALKAPKKRTISIDKSQYKEICYLKQRITKHSLIEIAEMVLGGSASELCDLILRDSLDFKSWNEVYRISSKWLSKNKTYTSFHAYFRNKYYRYKNYMMRFANDKFNMCIVNKKTINSKGVVLCFIGQDGSGKSTLSKDVEKWLSWKVSIHRFYLGSGEHYRSLFKSILNYGNQINHQHTQTIHLEDSSNTNPNNKKQKIRLLKQFGQVVSCINFVKVAKRAYKEVRRATIYSKKGAIALYDRFPQNQFMGIYDGPKIRSKYSNDLGFVKESLARKEEKYIKRIQKYQPSLVFKLLLSPEESIRRKPFENYANVKKKSEITKSLVFEHSTVYSIDASQPYADELLEVKKIIWSYLTKK